MLRHYLFCILLFANSSVTAQKITVKGKVIDSKSGIPLSGVSINIGNIGTATNMNGFFSLQIKKEITANNTINISHIGYDMIQLPFQQNKFYLIEMTLLKKTLSEVIVGSGAEIIVKKAIERIPSNYPANGFIMNGILRIYHSETDSPRVYHFFKSDAVLQLFYPSYLDVENDVEVKVIQNKTVFLNPNAASYDSSVWKRFYLVDDFVHKKSDFIKKDELDNFNYHFSGKTILQGSRVWIINFESKKKNHASGTLFIDTTTYAFVAAQYAMFNIKRLGSRTIKRQNYDVLFQNINDKWYLYKKSTYTEFLFSKSNLFGNTDFICTGINDSINFSPFKRKEIVRQSDEDIKIIKNAPDSSWPYYDSLFNKAEQEKTIACLQVPIVHTKSGNASDQIETYHQDEIPFHKRIDYLENTRVRLRFSIDYINIRSSSKSQGSLGIGFGAGIKILSNTYLHLLNVINFKDANKIITSKTGIGILHSININTTLRPVYITPSLGINIVQLTTKKEKFKTLFELVGGVGFSYPIKPKLRPFLTINYNKTIKEKGTLQIFYSTPVNFSAGTYFIF